MWATAATAGALSASRLRRTLATAAAAAPVAPVATTAALSASRLRRTLAAAPVATTAALSASRLRRTLATAAEIVAISIAGSGTAIEQEHRSALHALARCKPQAVVFDAAQYDPHAVAEAREMWRTRMRAEHESVPVLAALATQLIEAGATLDAQAVVLRIAIDEIRHAEICGEAVRALGGEPSCEINELPTLPVFRGVSAEERALRNVIFGHALVESVNTAQLVDMLDTMSDPYLREATRRLLADEVQHAAFGFEYLAAWKPWLDGHPEARQSLTRYLRTAFAELERVRSGSALPPRHRTADEVALGIADPARITVVFHQTVEGAIVPALEAFGLDAGSSWRARSAGT
jgi:hypothetical protein